MAEENQQPNQPPAPPVAVNPERKTLSDREKMSELERIRHSCAHVMATAILRLWPEAQFAYGPPVENGFYYDLELPHRISQEDFEKIEAEMKKEIKANNVFEKSEVTREQAIKDAESGRLGGLAERPGNASKFKLDLLKQIPEGEPISYFKNGDFIDLCAGPHVMASAILRLWPEAQFAYGPPVENGFYYDLELPHRISQEDFEKIEAEMKKEIKANNTFEKIVVTREQAIADANSGRLGGLCDRSVSAKFKLDLLKQIPEGEPISYFKNGDFIDLCAGPHVMRTGNIGAFKLTHVASAYYKGDERNPQLQRIYGTAFKNKTEMEAYFTMLEEAKKRDHRKIGMEMGLFAIDTEFVGPGLPLWLPKVRTMPRWNCLVPLAAAFKPARGP